MCCLRAFFFCLFVVDWCSCLVKAIFASQGPCSAHKRHCLQGRLTASQESLWSTGYTLTALPRRLIHPHRLGSTHTLSVSQRHSQWQSKGSQGLADELDQIPTSPLVTHLSNAAIQHRLCFDDDKHPVPTADIFHLKALPCEIKPLSRSLPSPCFAKFLLYSNICSLNNDMLSFIDITPMGSHYHATLAFAG